MTPVLTHLQRLEAESIHIFREVAASFSKPVMLYSVGSASTAMALVLRWGDVALGTPPPR